MGWQINASPTHGLSRLFAVCSVEKGRQPLIGRRRLCFVRMPRNIADHVLLVRYSKMDRIPAHYTRRLCQNKLQNVCNGLPDHTQFVSGCVVDTLASWFSATSGFDSCWERAGRETFSNRSKNTRAVGGTVRDVEHVQGKFRRC